MCHVLNIIGVYILFFLLDYSSVFLEWSHKLWWVHCEALVATLMCLADVEERMHAPDCTTHKMEALKKVCMHERMYEWMYVCMHACMYAYMQVCMNVCNVECACKSV